MHCLIREVLFKSFLLEQYSAWKTVEKFFLYFLFIFLQFLLCIDWSCLRFNLRCWQMLIFVSILCFKGGWIFRNKLFFQTKGCHIRSIHIENVIFNLVVVWTSDQTQALNVEPRSNNCCPAFFLLLKKLLKKTVFSQSKNTYFWRHKFQNRLVIFTTSSGKPISGASLASPWSSFT